MSSKRHRRKVLSKQREHGCLNKQRFADRTAAYAALMAATRAFGDCTMRVYRCRYAGKDEPHWHFGHP